MLEFKHYRDIINQTKGFQKTKIKLCRLKYGHCLQLRIIILRSLLTYRENHRMQIIFMLVMVWVCISGDLHFIVKSVLYLVLNVFMYNVFRVKRNVEIRLNMSYETWFKYSNLIQSIIYKKVDNTLYD